VLGDDPRNEPRQLGLEPVRDLLEQQGLHLAQRVVDEFVRLLESGVTLPWRYEGTPYEKVIDPDGVTTEYVRCPDPTSALVAKITRTRV